MKKMYIILAILIIIVLFYAFIGKKAPIFIQENFGDFATLSVPSNYGIFTTQNPNQGDLMDFFIAEFGTAPGFPSGAPGSNPYFKDYTQKLIFKFVGDEKKMYTEAGHTAYFSHLIVTVYNSNEPTETEDKFVQTQPPRDISFHVSSYNGPDIIWLNTISGDGYTVKNGVYKNGGPAFGKSTDLNVAVYTKNNVRLVLYTGSKVNSIDEADNIIIQAGNSLVVNQDKVKDYFSSAENFAKAEQSAANKNVKILNTQLKNMGCPSLVSNNITTCGDYTYALSVDGRRFYFIYTLFIKPLPTNYDRFSTLRGMNEIIGKDILSNGAIDSYSPEDHSDSNTPYLQKNIRQSIEDNDLITRLTQKISEGVDPSSVKFYSKSVFYLNDQSADVSGEIKNTNLVKNKFK